MKTNLSRKRVNLRSRISINTFRGAKTPEEVHSLLRFHRVGIHPNKFMADHNKRLATEQTFKLTMAANKRLAELRGRKKQRASGSRTRSIPWIYRLR